MRKPPYPKGWEDLDDGDSAIANYFQRYMDRSKMREGMEWGDSADALLKVLSDLLGPCHPDSPVGKACVYACMMAARQAYRTVDKMMGCPTHLSESELSAAEYAAITYLNAVEHNKAAAQDPPLSFDGFIDRVKDQANEARRFGREESSDD